MSNSFDPHAFYGGREQKQIVESVMFRGISR